MSRGRATGIGGGVKIKKVKHIHYANLTLNRKTCVKRCTIVNGKCIIYVKVKHEEDQITSVQRLFRLFFIC